MRSPGLSCAAQSRIWRIVIVHSMPERCHSSNGAVSTFCNRDIFADERLCGLDVQLSPRLQGVAATALVLADPVLSKIISPALSEFLNTGWPVTVIPQVPAGTIGISSRSLGNGWESSRLPNMGSPDQHLVATVSIATTLVRPHVQAIAVGLELTSIALPESIQSLLADELAKATKVPPRRP